LAEINAISVPAKKPMSRMHPRMYNKRCVISIAAKDSKS
jgi:hypothetical protein